MKNFLKHILAVFLAALTLSVIGHLQQSTAQNPDITPLQETYVGSHTSCSLSVTGSTKECKAADGVWISKNGGAYFEVTPQATSVTGVTSLNGKTGDLTVTAVSAAPVATTTATAGAVTVTVK